MIPIKREDFESIIDEKEGFAVINMRGIQIGILSLPVTGSEDTNRKFIEGVIENYLEAVEQITEWE